AGCNVAFFSADEKNGRELAQKSGARFYPASFSGGIFDDIAKAWGGLDGLVVTDGKIPETANVEELKRLIVVDKNPKLPSVENSDGLTVNGVNISGRSASDVAHLCLMLCLNASDCINRRII
ncbi:MAG: SDR family oxidoreductase, partial [Muribaculaceae bacterium]|nr:SDR family oxidoreductase [Muribaculaceae bacterium]